MHLKYRCMHMLADYFKNKSVSKFQKFYFLLDITPGNTKKYSFSLNLKHPVFYKVSPFLKNKLTGSFTQIILLQTMAVK